MTMHPQVGGRALLQRDPDGFVAVAGVEQCTGTVEYEERLRAHAFGVHSLLESVATPADYPAPLRPPVGLRTAPKAFQLQVVL
jgi:hypothetical protein